MPSFAETLRDPRCTDLVIQLALREIDSEPLACALVPESEDTRALIFRNMSSRAVAYLRDDIRRLERSAGAETIRAGQELYGRLLEKSLRRLETEGREAFVDEEPPTVDLSDREAVIRSFCALANYSREASMLPLLEGEVGAEKPLFRSGLLMFLEGWDPLLMRSVLEKHKTALLRALELECDLLIEGLDSLATGDNGLVTERRLRALVAGL